MRIPRPVVWLTVVIVAIGVGCAATTEEVVIGQFFAASRLRDRTSLRNFATVAFEPNEQGTITTFDVLGVTPERHSPLAASPNAAATGAVASERLVADLSVNSTGGPPLDVTKYEGEVVSRDVTIRAPVRPPAGPVVRKTLVMTLQRAVLSGAHAVRGRWIVTKVVITE